MTKYKIVGIVNLLAGIFQLFISFSHSLTIFPQLSSLYSDIKLSVQPSLIGGYIVITIMVLIATINLLLGFKGLTNTTEQDKYFKKGIIFAITRFS